MPQNVNDFNHNDLLSNIVPDINDNRQSSCQYFDSTLFNNKFGSMNNMSIFHCNITKFITQFISFKELFGNT